MEGVICRLQVTEFLCYVQLDHTSTESGTQELVVDQNTLLGLRTSSQTFPEPLKWDKKEVRRKNNIRRQGNKKNWLSVT